MKKKNIIIPIVLLVIGFAAVSTTLVLNGVVGVVTNKDNFVDGVVFDEDSLRTSNNDIIAEVSPSGRTLSFTTQTMTNVNDTSTVFFKIKNYSQYDAKLGNPAITCYFVSNHEVDKKATQLADNLYMDLIPGHELDGDKILGGGRELSEESNVTVKQIQSYIGNDTQEVKFQCEINATAVDSDIPSAEKSPRYTISFNSNGGNDVTETKTLKVGEEYGELPTLEERVGYTFLGWYDSEYYGDKIEPTTKVTIDCDHTLYAHWRPHTYYINYDPVSLAEVPDIENRQHFPRSAQFGNFVMINYPERPGYMFTGWTVTSGLNTSTAKSGYNIYEINYPISSDTMIVEGDTLMDLTLEESVTLTANWTIPVELPEGVTLVQELYVNGIADVGDKIRIGDTENFYVMSHTDTEILAIAEYNLNIGEFKDETKAEGIQQPGSNFPVKFSNELESYLNGNLDIKNTSSLDGPVKTALYGENGYEKLIKGILPDINTATEKRTTTVRLITKEDIEKLYNKGNELGTGKLNEMVIKKNYYWWISDTSYWTQTTNPEFIETVWCLDDDGYLNICNYDYVSDYGVRPVVEISLTN